MSARDGGFALAEIRGRLTETERRGERKGRHEGHKERERRQRQEDGKEIKVKRENRGVNETMKGIRSG